jgi:NAD(P)-dependent dehydrogenase (short-subunit alcohol dehydrogenase family)
VAPMVLADEVDFDFLMQVNVYGVFRVTAFPRMILKSKDRIINISSMRPQHNPFFRKLMQ